MGFGAFHPVFPVLKFLGTSFLKLDHTPNPRHQRFSPIFPLFRAKRLLLLGEYIPTKAFLSSSAGRGVDGSEKWNGMQPSWHSVVRGGGSLCRRGPVPVFPIKKRVFQRAHNARLLLE
jgi:hypothetical protein